MDCYTVVVKGCAYSFAHRDSYLLFLEEMKKRGIEVTSHQGGIMQSCAEGIAQFEQNELGREMAKEYGIYIKRYEYEDREY